MTSEFSKPIFFNFSNSPVSDSAHFVRRLVLFKISMALGAGRVEPPVAAGLVVKWWRKKLQELADEDADTRSIRDWRVQMRNSNCHPSTVHANHQPPTQVCRHAYCPWCYSRLAHNFADKMGYHDVLKFKEMTGASRFLWLGRQITVPALPKSSDPIDPAEELVKAVKGESSTCRAYSIMYRQRLWASTWQVVIEPVGEFGEERAGWSVSSRFFALTKISPPSVIDLGMPYGWNVHEGDPSMENLEQALKGLYTYPVGFVTGDPELSRLAVLARKGLRLRESTGWFREIREGNEGSDAEEETKVEERSEA